MAHYAFLDENNIVTQVIVGRDETEVVGNIKDWEAYYGAINGVTCKRTSYNNNIRKNFAGIGYTYDPDRDAFIPPKPFESWVLDEETCRWEAPVPYPDDGVMYQWDEETTDWVAVVYESDTPVIES